MKRALAAVCLCLVVGCTLPGFTTSRTPEPTPATQSQGLARAAATAASTPSPRRRPRTPVDTPAPQPTALPLKRTPILDGLLDGLAPVDAEYSLVLEDLASGARTAINADRTLPSASLYKLGVAWTVMRQVDSGGLNLDAPVEITDDDAVEPEPDGGFGVGDTPSVRELTSAMLSVSSNASAHALLRFVGRNAFTSEMERVGLHHTRVPEDGPAVTSASDIARLLRLIASSGDLSGSSRSLIADCMANIAPPDALRDTLPAGVGIFDKTGNLEDASNVGALLETPLATAILVVIDTGVDPGDARAVIALTGQVAYHALLH